MTLYLIEHKVRGKPALDIATCCEEMGTDSDPGPWWIIPTSGHRAYPYWWQELSLIISDANLGCPLSCPDNWPDHYQPVAAPKGQGQITNLAERLGLLPKINRRL